MNSSTTPPDDPLSDSTFKQIMFGSLLGDGGIWARINGTAIRFHEHHSMKQADYLQWKNAIFGFHYHEGKKKQHSCQIQSRCRPFLRSLYNTFYHERKKIVNLSILNQIDALGLLIWYLDDGTYNNWTQTAHICTNAFTIEEHAVMTRWFQEKWNILAKAKPKKNSTTKKIELLLYFPRKELDKLFDIIVPVFRDYTLPRCMLFKFGHYVPENREILENTRNKRKSARRLSVFIKSALLQEIIDRCTSTKNESFGLLYGTYPKRLVERYILFDKDNLETIDTDDKNCIGWFHSHIEGLLPSTTDRDTHRGLFKLDKYIMMIIDTQNKDCRIYDHIKDDGSYRLCQFVMNENYQRHALPDNNIIIQHLKDGLNPKEIASKYGVSAEAVYSLLRRQGIPIDPNRN